MFGSLTRERLGIVLIVVGVVAWIPYGVMKYGLGEEVTVYPFLAWHLVGIIPGFALRRGKLMLRWIMRARPPSAEG